MNDRPSVLGSREKFSFAGALLGQTVIFNFVNLYLLIFYTDVFGIGAAAAGTLFLVARVWDAVNDPIMGILVDKTSTRWGKCRPYLLFAPLPIVALTVLLFSSPDLPSVGKVVFASITYILWGMAYTSLDIPLWTMSSRMTVDSEERQSLIGLGRIFNILGSAVPVALAVPLKQALGGGNEGRGYFLTAIVFGLFAVPFMLQGFHGTRERTDLSDGTKPGISEILRAVFKNSPLLLLLASSILAVFINLPVSAGIYFATYALGDEGLFAVLAGTVLLSAVVGSLLAPPLARRFSSRNILIVTSAASMVLFIAGWFIGYASLPLVIVLAFVIGTLLGIPLVLRTSMLADTVEFAEMKTGKRTEGIIFSTLTFTGKLKLGVAAFLSGLVLKFADYVPNAAQSPRSLEGIFLMLTLIPALGCLLTIVPLLFYRLSDEDHKRIVETLEGKEHP